MQIIQRLLDCRYALNSYVSLIWKHIFTELLIMILSTQDLKLRSSLKVIISYDSSFKLKILETINLVFFF